MNEERKNVLPSVPLPEDHIEINGQTVTFRSLSRAEAMRVSTQFRDNPDGAETFIIACGVGVTEEEAAKWRAEIDPITAGKLVDAIIILTGLVDDPKNP